MTGAEMRRARRQAERRRTEVAQLLARKLEREEKVRRTRMAMESEAFALKHHLPPERVFQQQPVSTLSAGFNLRNELSDEERSA